MLPDILLLVAAGIVGAIAFLFQSLTTIFGFAGLPLTDLSNALIWMFSGINAVGGFIDVPYLAKMMLVFLAFLAIWYGYKLALKIISFFMLKGGSHPEH